MKAGSLLAAVALTLLVGERIDRALFFATQHVRAIRVWLQPDRRFVGTRDGTVNLVRAGGARFHPQSFSKTCLPETFE